jgi:hypothetical protein
MKSRREASSSGHLHVTRYEISVIKTEGSPTTEQLDF